jgi:hypothetical protein
MELRRLGGEPHDPVAIDFEFVRTDVDVLGLEGLDQARPRALVLDEQMVGVAIKLPFLSKGNGSLDQLRIRTDRAQDLP